MKKTLLMVAAALMAMSCNGGKFHVIGSYEPAPEDNTMVVMVDQTSGAVDTAYVKNGKFSFKGDADITTMKVILDPEHPGEDIFAEFIPEPGTVKVILGEVTQVQGGAITESYKAFTEEYNDLYAQYGQGTLSETEAGDAMTQLSKKTYEANKDNIVGLVVMQNLAYDLPGEELEAMLENAAPIVSEDPQIAKIRESKVAETATAEGKMFADFKGVSPDGKQVKLSDFVGKGQYVLVDFWASWCGPCKRELPNIKAVYEQYKDKGLTVLGVAVWDGDNTDSRTTMEQYDMKWDQIFAGDDHTPTDIYGIVGIPHIILFAPDGTVYKRNLRGENIIAAVSAVLD